MLPSTARNITVSPCSRMVSALPATAVASMPSSSRNGRLPRWMVLPSTFPVTPFPVKDSNASTPGTSKPRSRALFTMAAARGCSLPCSTLAPMLRTSSLVNPGAGNVSTSLGFPRVRVPVLSTTRVSTFFITSIASAFLKRTPAVAPFPVATMIDMGVASPRAQGHAMMRTATALMMARAIRGSGPKRAHTTKVRIAMQTTDWTK
ncbi:MAG: hypothetical protein A4E57_04666 [Syntrophorhabdaceae bacterium PtaU1.Bin034]|nr:MAG: hypothetical protein A4E57_04666 [Syntrophorhabdaceae bacterium PtaU1.Bin034]